MFRRLVDLRMLSWYEIRLYVKNCVEKRKGIIKENLKHTNCFTIGAFVCMLIPFSLYVCQNIILQRISFVAYLYTTCYIAIDVKNHKCTVSKSCSIIVLVIYFISLLMLLLVWDIHVLSYPTFWETEDNFLLVERIVAMIVIQFLAPYVYTFYLLENIPDNHVFGSPIRGLIWTLLVFLISSHALFDIGIIDKGLILHETVEIREYMDLPKYAFVAISYISLENYEAVRESGMPIELYLLHLMLPIVFVNMVSNIPKYKKVKI